MNDQKLKILFLAMYRSNYCVFWPSSYKQTLKISLLQQLQERERGRLGLSCRRSLQPSRKNWRTRRFWRENWMKERQDILTLNWKTSLLMKINSHCWLRTALQRLQCIFYHWSYGNTRISTAPELQRLFEGGAYLLFHSMCCAYSSKYGIYSKMWRESNQKNSHFPNIYTHTLDTHFIIINNLHLHKVHFRPQIAGASRGGREHFRVNNTETLIMSKILKFPYDDRTYANFIAQLRIHF